MDILTSLKVSFFGFLVVFVVLGLISVCIRILSKVLLAFGSKQGENQMQKTPMLSEAEVAFGAETGQDGENDAGYGELKLYGVDEKTAAMIMAIVSDEAQVPLSELQFKSIKLLDN